MAGNPQDREPEFEHIDADAVCEACANVNPPGTLLCKICGNNLRDQRVRRMQAGGPVEMAQPKLPIGTILRGIGAVVAFIVIGVVALNVQSIEQWATSGYEARAESTISVSPEIYWSGPDAPLFEAMAVKIDESPLTVAQASAVPSGTASSTFDGFYVLKRSTDPVATVLGAALVQTNGDIVKFVAILADGTEIRAEATKNSDTIAEAINVGIRDVDGVVTGGYGFAQIQANGEIECTGMYGPSDTQISGVAILIPEDAAATPAQEEVPSDALVDPIEAAEAAAEAATAESAQPQ